MAHGESGAPGAALLTPSAPGADGASDSGDSSVLSGAPSVSGSRGRTRPEGAKDKTHKRMSHLNRGNTTEEVLLDPDQGDQGVDQWKHSIIKPLHKAGDINTASNYRPISLLPVLFKILEKVISNQLSTHLDKSNLLHPNQYAYRKHTSTQDALLNITEKI
ncbi:Reverse transcriptase domain [Trinorchestia longiramus]|nr:Reverse transcriptase domain [Trinorchestia longiramus]